jgi:RND family efflux transporter MFP subunit
MQGALSALRSAVCVIAAALLASCGSKAEEPAQTVAAPPPLVEVVSAVSGDSAGAVRASGLLAYKRETALGFGTPGEIETLTVDEGDRVAAGQTLATLRKTTSGADASEAALARQTAEQNFERISRLHASGAASQVDLDNARLALERARERIAIVAPASGVILQRNAERGQMVSAGQPVLMLGEANTGLIVKASLASSEVTRIGLGDPVEVQVRGRDPLSGKVARIPARTADGSGAFEIEVQIDQPQGLRSGEVAEVLIRPAVASTDTVKSFTVPAIALIDARADQGIVFVVDAEGRARSRAVETGGVTDDGVVILKGLAEGDRVITRGASMVRDGDQVRLAVASE